MLARPASGGDFSGGYTGTYRGHCAGGGGNFIVTGKGEVSFLGRSREYGQLTGRSFRHKDIWICIDWHGHFTLTSIKNPKTYIEIKVPLPGGVGYPPCAKALSYTVNGGGGEFAKATGSGSLQCSGPESAYTDQWSGTLNY